MCLNRLDGLGQGGQDCTDWTDFRQAGLDCSSWDEVNSLARVLEILGALATN